MTEGYSEQADDCPGVGPGGRKEQPDGRRLSPISTPRISVRTAAVGDLRVGRFMDEYLPAAVDAETLAANDRTAEERLAAAKMIVSVDAVPTVAGVLVLGKQPQHAYVQFLRIAGREWGGEVLDEARCTGRWRIW